MKKSRARPPRRTEVMTVDELCQYLRVHPTTVYRLIKQGKIPAFRVGGRWRFEVEAVDRWLKQS